MEAKKKVKKKTAKKRTAKKRVVKKPSPPQAAPASSGVAAGEPVVVAPQDIRLPNPVAEERERAREERQKALEEKAREHRAKLEKDIQERKAAERAAREARRVAANQGVANPKATGEKPAPVESGRPAPPPRPKATPPNGQGQQIQTQIPESLKWKLVAHQERAATVEMQIRQSVRALFQQRMEEAIKGELAKHAEYQERVREARVVVNEVIDAVEPTLPNGYAIDNIDEKSGVITASHDPKRVGVRLGV